LGSSGIKRVVSERGGALTQEKDQVS